MAQMEVLMKFEKLNENKIRIILSIKDLVDKDISLHDFMSSSIESQDLFLDILEEAEEKIGFKARNCKIKIEALAMTENNFVLTITKVSPTSNKKTLPIPAKVRPQVKRKCNVSNSNHLLYKFISFDDYCNFIEFLLSNNLNDSFKIAENITVYTYKNNYYLDLYNINAKYKKSSTFITVISEFSSYVLNPDLFICKLNELGTIFVKNNAFKKCFKKMTKSK